MLTFQNGPKPQICLCAEGKQFRFKHFILLPACSLSRGPDGAWTICRAKVFIYTVCFTFFFFFSNSIWDNNCLPDWPTQISFGPLHIICSLITNLPPFLTATSIWLPQTSHTATWKGSYVNLLNPLDPNAVVCDVEVIEDVGRLIGSEDLVDG